MQKSDYLQSLSIERSGSIFHCLQKIDKNKSGFLVVLDNKKLYGVITDGDIRRAILDGCSLDEPVDSFTSSDYVFIQGNIEFFKVASIFKDSSVKFLPVVDDSNFLVDLITKDQFEDSVLFGEKIEDLDKDISENHHQIVPKPWGYYKTTLLTPDYQSKILCLYPGQSISLQSHSFREEHWVNVKGLGEVTIGESIKQFVSGDYVFIPRGCKHRLKNISPDQELICNEVQLGSNFDEDDIIRYEDDYGR